MSSLHRVARFPKPAATATTDPTNMGTYNYCGEYVQDGQISLSGAKHAIFDILPYETYGNTTPDDKPDSEYSSSKNGKRYYKNDAAETARSEFLTYWEGSGNE